MKLPKQIRVPTLIAILAGVLLIALVVANEDLFDTSYGNAAKFDRGAHIQPADRFIEIDDEVLALGK